MSDTVSRPPFWFPQWLLVVFVLGLYMPAFAQESITAPANGTVGVPLSVDFTGLSAPSYTVNWGDGQSENLLLPRGINSQTLVHTYSAAGVFTLELAVQGRAGLTVLASTALQIVNAVGCTVLLSPSPVSLGSSVTASVQGLNAGTSVQLEWGDGATDSVIVSGSGNLSQTHTYGTVGTYAVKVLSGTTPACVSSLVVSYPVPVLSIPSPLILGQSATAALSNLNSALSYTLDWGDGSSDAIPNPGSSSQSLTHTYASTGIKVLKLSAAGITDVVQTLSVYVPQATLSLSANPLQVNQNVTATLSGLLSNVSYTLDWGDTTTDTISAKTSTTLSHAYSSTGAKLLRLSAGGMTDVTSSLTVNLPSCSFSSTPTALLLGESLSATVNGLPAGFSFKIHWGDVAEDFTTSSNQPFSVSHTYTNPAGYALRTLYNDAQLCPEITNVSVSVPNPQLSFSTTTPLLNQNLSLTLAGLAPAVSYSLEWGDGSTETITNQKSASFSHAYSSLGVKSVVFKATNFAVAPVTYTVNVGAPNPVLTVNSSVFLGQPASLNLSNLVSSLNYTLDWGDGSSETITNQTAYTSSHAYTSTGLKTVQLSASGVSPQVGSVQVLAPSLSFTPSDPLVGQTVQFRVSNAYNGVAYALNLGDGVSEAVSGGVVNHAYGSAGTKVVTLEAPAGYTLPPVTATVPVGAASCSLTTDFGSLLLGMSVKASGTASYPGMALTLEWGDGDSQALAVGINSLFSADHVYANKGTYVLKAMFGGSLLCQTTVNVTVPQPNLTLNPPAILLGQNVTANLSNLAPGATYTLDWGDGSTETITSQTSTARSHVFVAEGTKLVQLSAAGLPPSTQSLSIGIPSLSAAPSSLLVGQTASVTLSDLNSGLAYTLDWGDGYTPSIVGKSGDTLTHIYWTGSPKVIRLILPNGYTATIPPASLSVVAPSLSASTGSLGVQESFTLSISDLNPSLVYTLSWGDGISETIQSKTSSSLTHSYSSAGAKTITLNNSNMTPDITLVVGVALPSCSLSLNPTSLFVGSPLTASVTGLPANFAATLDWGDGQTQDFSASATGTFSATHSFASAGAFVVKVVYQGAPLCQAVANVSVPIPTLSVTPASATVGQSITATLGGLAPGISYSLNWGDGQSDPINKQTAVTLTHAYSTTGSKVISLSAVGVTIPSTTATVQISVPAPVLAVTPLSAQVGQSLTANLSSLIAEVSYTLDWGDGQTEAITGKSSVTLTHTYTSVGSKVIALSTPSGVSIPPTTATVSVSALVPTLGVDTSSPVLGQRLKLSLGNLVSALTYTLEWGDGSSETITGQASLSLSHAYTSDGAKIIRLTPPVELALAPLTQSVNVQSPTLSASPNMAAPGQTIMLTLGNLEPTLNYQLDWGDGNPVDTIGGKSTTTLTHSYTSTGAKLLKLGLPSGYSSTPSTQTVTIADAVCTLTLTPSGLLYGQAVSASGSGLPAGYALVLDWGDQTQDTLTSDASGNFSASHTVAKLGAVMVKASYGGTTLCQATLTITIPAPTLSVTPASGLLGSDSSVNLSDLAPGVNYQLDWGDGTVETISAKTSATSSHTFKSSGAHVISLTSVGNLTALVTATVNLDPPNMSFAGDVALGAASSLTVSNLVPTLSYSLDWGDGSSETITGKSGATLSHTYTTVNAKVAKLTLPTGFSLASPIQAVTNVVIPTPTLGLSPATGVLLGQTVTANISNLAQGASYILNWGDGGSETISGKTSATSSHVYNSGGLFGVTLLQSGNTLAGAQITITAPGLTVSPNAAILSQIVTADLSDLASGSSYSLDWGDGQTNTITGKSSTTLTHAYTSAGAKTVSLSLGSFSLSRTVSVTAPTTCDDLTLPATAQLGQAINLNVLIRNSLNLPLNLDWGDSQTQTISTNAQGIAAASHSYTAVGNFTVKVFYGTSPLCQSAVAISVPQPTLSVVPASANAGQNVNAQLGNLLPALSYSLDWGDGTTETISGQSSATPIHSYSSAGSKTITLTPPTGLGVTAVSGTVSVSIPLFNFTLGSSTVPLGQSLTVSFSGLVSSVSYTLDWGDGQTETITSLSSGSRSHTYAQLGSKVVNLYVTGNPTGGGNGLQVVAPSLNVPSSVDLGKALSVSVANLAANLSYTLDWGDGQSETITGKTSATSSHTYATPGPKTIQLSLPSGYAVPPIQASLLVTNPSCTFSATSLVLGQSLNFQGSNFAPGAISLEWGDGGSDSATVSAAGNFAANHTYSSAGNFTVKALLGTQVLCQQTVAVSIPTPTMTATPASPALFESFTLNLSNLATGATYTLDWGDGNNASISNKSSASLNYAYSSSGPKTLKLTANGINPVVQTLTVLAPNITLSPATARPGDTITATIFNLVPSLSYTFRWNDGATQVLTGKASFSLTHSYANPADYTPDLTLPFASTDTVSAKVSIAVPTPTIALSVTVLEPKQTVTATLGNLVPGGSYTLNWGDNTSETITGQSQVTRSHSYTTTGSYTLNLTASSWPVTASASLQVTVPQPVLKATPSRIVLGQSVALEVGGLAAGASYILEWGDGSGWSQPFTGLTSTNSSHTYGSLGQKIIHLKLYQDTGDTYLSVEVVAPSAIQLTPNPAGLGQSVRANLNSLDPAMSYTLEWGDGQTETITAQSSLSFQHIYQSSGDKTLRLVPATGIPITQTLSVVAPTLSVPATAFVQESVSVNLTTLVPGLTYTLDWGDGSTSPVAASGAASDSFSHIYQRGGSKTLKLTLPIGLSSNPITALLSINNRTCQMNLSANPVLVDQLLSATITGLPQGFSLEFDWGDGKTETVLIPVGGSAIPQHNYTTLGNFSVRALVGGDTICQAAVSTTISTPNLSLEQPAIQAGQTVKANLASLAASQSYTLDWGDGSSEPISGTTQQASHNYPNPGSYTVSLISPKASGLAPQTANLVVQVPTPTLSFSPNPASHGKPVTLNLTGLLPVASYTLAWGDGGNETVQNLSSASLTHTYLVTGTQTISLTLNGSLQFVGGQSKVDQSITVSSSSFTVSLEPAVETNQSFTLSLSNLMSNLTYTVDWGNGGETISNKTSADLSHSYSQAGSKTITISTPGQPATKVVLQVMDRPSLSLNQNTLVYGQEVVANLTGLVASSNYRLEWGSVSQDNITGQNSATLHKSLTPGSYTLILKNLSFPNLPNVSAQVSVGIPSCALSPSINRGNLSLAGSNLPAGLAFVVQWGDGKTDSGQADASGVFISSHTYFQNANFTVTLKDAANLGLTFCSATVAASQTEPTLTLSSPTIAAGDTLSVTVAGLDPNQSYSLDFGDGTPVVVSNKTAGSFSHLYSGESAGSYTLKLLAANAAVLAGAALEVLPPSITLPNPASAGEPISLSLRNLSAALTYRLEWGDGSSDSLSGKTSATLSHTYALSYSGQSIKLVLSNSRAIFTSALTLLKPSFSLEPNPAAIGQTVTATISDLSINQSYVLVWPDGSQESISGKSSVSLKHVFAKALGDAVSLKVGSTLLQQTPLSVKAPSLTFVGGSYTAFSPVQFSLEGLAAEASYSVDWGDGQNETVSGKTNFTLNHSYTSTGLKRVQVGFGSNLIAQTEFSLEAPSGAQVSLTPAEGVVGSATTVALSGLSPNQTFSFDWGDGNSNEVVSDAQGKASLSHTYSKGGTFTLALKLGDSKLTGTLYQVFLPQPKVQFTYGGQTTDSINVPLGQTITAQISGLIVGQSYTLEWGDSSEPLVANATNLSRTHTYWQPTNAKVRFIHADALRDAYYSVLASAPLMQTSPNPQAGKTMWAQFASTLSGASYTLEWGDGSSENYSSGIKEHLYARSGTYTLALKLSGQTVLEKPVNVALAQCSLEAYSSYTDLPSGYTFLAQVQGLFTLKDFQAAAQIDWGDGAKESFAVAPTNPGHTYQRSGRYNVTVFNAAEAGAICQTSVGVATRPPSLEVLGSPTTVAVGTEVKVNAANLIEGESYLLDWGDGEQQAISGVRFLQVGHIYKVAASRTLRLRLQGNPGYAVESPSYTLAVSASGLKVLYSEVLVGERFGLEILSPASGVNYSVDWGDGTTDQGGSQHSHSYSKSGQYTFKIRVIAQGQTIETGLSGSVVVHAPELKLEPSSVMTNQSVQLSVSGLLGEILEYEMDWGDGETSRYRTGSGINLTHQYKAAKEYTLSFKMLANSRFTEQVWRTSVGVDAPRCQVMMGGSTYLTKSPLPGMLQLSPYSHLDLVLAYPDGSTLQVSGAYVEDPSRKFQTVNRQIETHLAGEHTLLVYASNDRSQALCQTAFTVYPNRPVLSLDDNSIEAGDAVTLHLSDLLPAGVGGDYVLDWGDGTRENFKPESGSLERSHTYTVPGEFVVKLHNQQSIEGQQDAEALKANVYVVLFNERLYAGMNPNHVSQEEPLLVGFPAYFVLHGLSDDPRYSYGLQVNQGEPIEVSKSAGESEGWTPNVKYSFPTAGSYTLRLLVKVKDGPWITRQEWKHDAQRFAINSIKLVTEQNLPKEGLLLTWGQDYKTYLEVSYSGYGRLSYRPSTQITSEDGRKEAQELPQDQTADLPAGQDKVRIELGTLSSTSAVGYGNYQFNVNLTKLLAGPTEANNQVDISGVKSPSLAYQVALNPSKIRFGENVLELDSISNHMPSQFSAKAHFDFIVAGKLISTIKLDLKNLHVSRGRSGDEVMLTAYTGNGTGDVIVIPVGGQLRPLELGDSILNLKQLRLDYYGAHLDLNLQINRVKQSYDLTNASLNLETGDLYGELWMLSANNQQPSAQFGNPDIDLKAESNRLILDLSRAKNPTDLATAFAGSPTPKNLEGWMGIYFGEIRWVLGYYAAGNPDGFASAETRYPLSLNQRSPAALDSSGLNYDLRLNDEVTLNSDLKINLHGSEIAVVSDQLVKQGGTATLSNAFVFGQTMSFDAQVRFSQRGPWDISFNDQAQRFLGNLWVRLGEGRVELYEKQRGLAALRFPTARWGSSSIQSTDPDHGMPLPNMVAVSWKYDLKMYFDNGGAGDFAPYQNDDLTINNMEFHASGIRLIKKTGGYSLSLEGRAVVVAGLTDSFAPGTPTSVIADTDGQPTSQPQLNFDNAGDAGDIAIGVGVGFDLPSGKLKVVATNTGFYVDVSDVTIKMAKVGDLEAKGRVGVERVGSERVYYGYLHLTADVNKNKSFRVGAMKIDKIFGGMAYHMRWPVSAGAEKFMTEVPEIDPDTTLQLQLGLEMHLEPKGRFKAIGVLSLDTSGDVNIVVDAWVLKDSGSANARGLIRVNSNGFLAQLCLGPASLPSEGIKCDDLERFNYKGIVSGYGFAEIKILSDGRFHLLLGTPESPITLQFPANSDTFTYHGYFMAGNSKESFYIPTSQTTEQLDGVWVGIGTSFHTSGRESEDLGLCTGYFEWDVELGYDVYIRLNFEDFNYLAGMALYARLHGEAGCGIIEFGASVGVDIRGEISGPSPTRFSGTYSGYIELDFGFTSVSFGISGSISQSF